MTTRDPRLNPPQVGQVITPKVIQDMQLGPRFDADTTTFPRLPSGEENPNWLVNQRDPLRADELDPSLLGGSLVGGIVSFDDSTSPILGFVALRVSAGCMLNSKGEKRCWLDSQISVQADETIFIWADGDSISTGAQILFSNGVGFPPRTTPHIVLAQVLTDATDIVTNTDLRPISHVGTTHDFPLALENTECLDATSTTVVAAQGEFAAFSNTRVLCDATLGSFAVVLPENPADGDVVGIADVNGSFGDNPIIIRPHYQIIATVRVNSHLIQNDDNDWILDVNGTYIELFFSTEKNSWFFRELPDTDCALKLGAFIGCGAADLSIDQEVNCVAPNVWDAVKLRCFRPSTTATFSDGAGGSFDRANNSRCQSNPPAGTFLQCVGSTAEFADGSGGVQVVSNSAACGAIPASAIPVGVMMPFAGATLGPSADWAVCDGTAVSRVTYAALFNAIGTSYGVGDGSTTFNLPNMSGRFPWVDGGILGSVSGATEVTLTTSNIPDHSHIVVDPGHNHSVSDPGHGHGVNDPGHSHGYDRTGVDIDFDDLPWAASNNDGRFFQQPTTAAGTGISIAAGNANIAVNANGTGITIPSSGGGGSVPDPISTTGPILRLGAWIIKIQ